jgi:hypothetical protein
MQWTASGDPTQQDSVDESTNTTNTTSYLMVLQSNKLWRYHTVEGTLGEDNLLNGTLTGRPVKFWPHYTATTREKTGQRYAVAPGLATTVKIHRSQRSRIGISKVPVHRNGDLFSAAGGWTKPCPERAGTLGQMHEGTAAIEDCCGVTR